jgi:hypothetical protein|uniref:Uncharacterized protein n=1 Tax=viral metagenome TaxID=1070528 RepID=A0A6C0H241_9ZZZZ
MYSNIDEAWQTSMALDKYKSGFKPVKSVVDATNELKDNNLLESDVSNKSSENSIVKFKEEIRDLKSSIKLDDGKQCQRLFSHFQTCKKCRNKIIEKFSLNDINNETASSFKFTENFIDLTKYTEMFKNKNTNNIISIILFGLLIIIILSLLSNESK